MNSYDKQVLLGSFRTAFSDIDHILQSAESPFKPRKISEFAQLAEITLMLNAFLRRYEIVLDDTERDIIKSRIDSGIDKLLKLNQSHILSLYYFKKNYRRNPRVMELRVRNFMTSIRVLFELAPVSRIPLDSTIWNYFVRDISDFVNSVIKAVETSNGEMRGRLSFLLLIIIHSLIAISKALVEATETSKISELWQKAQESLQDATRCFFNLFKTGSLELVFDTSPGFVIYVNRVLKEDLTRFDGDTLSELESTANKKLEALDFGEISERTKNFFILNAMELGLEPPRGITPTGKDALAFLADGFVRFEKGERYLGVLPIEEDVRALIRKLAKQVATKTDIEKIEILLTSQQERFQKMLRQKMGELQKTLQIQRKLGKNKTNRFWDILERIATISDTIEFIHHLRDLFTFLHENKIMALVMPLILKMFLG